MRCLPSSACNTSTICRYTSLWNLLFLIGRKYAQERNELFTARKLLSLLFYNSSVIKNNVCLCYKMVIFLKNSNSLTSFFFWVYCFINLSFFLFFFHPFFLSFFFSLLTVHRVNDFNQNNFLIVLSGFLANEFCLFDSWEFENEIYK